MNSFINTIALLITDKCTANCDICCFECSMKKDALIDIDLVYRTIDEASTIPSIKTLGLSGGEPFLFYEDMLRITDYATKNGLRVTCTTNSFWATNDEVTFEKLYELKKCGLKKVGLSIDQFHNEYVDIQNVKRVLAKCKLLDIETEVGSVVTKNKHDIYHLFSELGDAMLGVKQQMVPCLPVGNALTRIKTSDFYYNENILLGTTNCKSLTYVAIMTNGDVYPCCSQAGATRPLLLGNLNEYSLLEIIKKYNSNMHIRLLRKQGLHWYIEHATKSNAEKIQNSQYVSACHLCRTIMTNKSILEEVEPHIDLLREEIFERYNARVSVHG